MSNYAGVQDKQNNNVNQYLASDYVYAIFSPSRDLFLRTVISMYYPFTEAEMREVWDKLEFCEFHVAPKFYISVLEDLCSALNKFDLAKEDFMAVPTYYEVEMHSVEPIWTCAVDIYLIS